MGQWLAGFESRLVPDLPLPFIPTLIGLRAFDLVSSRVWWEATTNITYYDIAVQYVSHNTTGQLPTIFAVFNYMTRFVNSIIIDLRTSTKKISRSGYLLIKFDLVNSIKFYLKRTGEIIVIKFDLVNSIIIHLKRTNEEQIKKWTGTGEKTVFP